MYPSMHLGHMTNHHYITQGGVWQNPWADTHLGRHPLWTDTPWVDNPWVDTTPGQKPPDRHPPLTDRHTHLPDTATAADDTHPIGMHSCLF